MRKFAVAWVTLLAVEKFEHEPDWQSNDWKFRHVSREKLEARRDAIPLAFRDDDAIPRLSEFTKEAFGPFASVWVLWPRSSLLAQSDVVRRRRLMAGGWHSASLGSGLRA